MSKSDEKVEQARFMLRLPAELDARLKQDAQAGNRSKNRHIAHLLESSLNQGVSSGVSGNDTNEMRLLTWFRGLSEQKKSAFLTLTLDD